MAFRKSRLLLLVVASAMMGAGAGLYADQTPVQTPSVKTRAVPPVSEGGVRRFKSLIEAGEKAVKAEDWDAVADNVGDAQALVEAWPPEQRQRPEEQALVERLKDLQQLLDAENAAEQEQGLKMAEETVTLTGEDLRNQLAQVKAAEQDVVFDFPIDLNDKVLAWVYEFTHGKRGFVEGALSRSTQFMPMIRQIFQEERVPQDLAYLALIESGFRNAATSHAAAVGMWQFIRSTGRIFGLTGNAWIEERRDPVKSCRASARYLRHLYEASGDWYLALAGYNAGPLTVERAENALGTHNFWDMTRSGMLRDETKQYVPKMLAAVLVGRFPERYGLNVTQMTPYAFESVEVDRMTSLSVLAKFAGTDVEALKDLNPELLRATTPPGHYTLKVPPGTSQDTYRALARIPSGQRLDFQTYVIRRADTLSKIAARFQITPEDLLEANHMTTAKFKVGRRIQVPPAAPGIDDRDLQPVAAKDRALIDRPLSSLPAIPPSKPADAEPLLPRGGQAPKVAAADLRPPKVAETAAKSATHVVKRGETLYSIAERYGLNVSDLKTWNRIKRNQITVGQRLKLRRS